MKKGIKIMLWTLGLLGALVGGVVIWQWQNIKAVSGALRYSKEEIAEQIEVQKMEIETVLKEYGLENIGDFTLEEEEAIRKGTMTFEEALEAKIKREQEAKVQGSLEEGAQGTVEGVISEAGTVGDKTQSAKEDAKEENDKTSQATAQMTGTAKASAEQSINQMYALKAKYLGALGSLESQAISEYKSAKAAGEDVTPASVVSKYVGTGLGLQGQCDGEVAAVLNNLKSTLVAEGASTAIIPVMKAAYEREKELKKSYYLSLIK